MAASPVTDPASPPPLSTPDLLRRRAEAHPDSVALNVDDTGSLTYRAWDRRSEAVARTLLDRGVRPGDRIVLLFGGLAWVDYATAYIGVFRAGGTAVHVAGREPAAELWRRIGHTGPVGIVHGAEAAPPGGFAGWTRWPRGRPA
jgi:acyl-CoA synthetase (AMP-forming)/AMP-acid ligase II